MIGFFKRITARVVEFIVEVRAELVKVAWPTRHEIVASTWVVIIGVCFVAVWIFAADTISQGMMTALLGVLR